MTTQSKPKLIYRLRNTVNNKEYIGSTTMSLNKRLATHRSMAKDEGKGTSALHRMMRETGPYNWSIELVVDCSDYSDQDAFKMREQLEIIKTRSDRLINEQRAIDLIGKKAYTKQWLDSRSEEKKEEMRVKAVIRCRNYRLNKKMNALEV